MLNLPTKLHFPIAGKRVTYRGSKLTNFRLALDQVVLLETAANV